VQQRLSSSQKSKVNEPAYESYVAENEQRAVLDRNCAPVVKYFANSCAANNPQEDRFVVHTSGDRGSIFGVFDGHAGSEAVEFCHQNSLKYVTERMDKIARDLHNSAHYDPEKIPNALQTAFLDLDKDF
jgi:serine/threonine protein phosphatase PrpC